jgi:hypothetical protein
MSAFELDAAVAELVGLKEHEGYWGVFTRAEVLGAWRNGTVVVKIASDEVGDYTANGTLGKVMGSLHHPDQGVLYFIEWDDKPGIVIGCMAKKLRARL